MAAYFNKGELKTSLETLIKNSISECKSDGTLSQHCIDLIKYNFLAEFVIYNKEAKTIEIGVDSAQDNARYPKMTTHVIHLKDAEKKLNKSFRNNNEDLEFYGKLLRKTSGGESSPVVVYQ